MAVVIALYGLASASPPRTSTPGGTLSSRHSEPDQLQKEINDHILPLLSPRRKSDTSKPQLQLTDLLSDPLKRHSKPFDSKSRGKSPLHIFVADLPRGSKYQGVNRDEQYYSGDEDDDISHDSNRQDESADATREANHKLPAVHDLELESEFHEDRTASDSDELPRHEHERHASHEAEMGRAEDSIAWRAEPETGKHERAEQNKTEDVRSEIRGHEHGQADAARDQPVDDTFSNLQLLSQDIASALTAEQPAESTEERRVMDCVERRESGVSSPSVEVQELEPRAGHAHAGFWHNHFVSDSRPEESDVGWGSGDALRADPQKAYHLSFRFTKK